MKIFWYKKATVSQLLFSFQGQEHTSIWRGTLKKKTLYIQLLERHRLTFFLTKTTKVQDNISVPSKLAALSLCMFTKKTSDSLFHPMDRLFSHFLSEQGLTLKKNPHKSYDVDAVVESPEAPGRAAPRSPLLSALASADSKFSWGLKRISRVLSDRFNNGYFYLGLHLDPYRSEE